MDVEDVQKRIGKITDPILVSDQKSDLWSGM